MEFDYSVKLRQLEQINKIDPTVANEVISEDYQAAIQELSELMTFIPEEERKAAIDGFVRSILLV